MTEPTDIRRRRLYWRATHRGTKEMDLLFGELVKDHMANITDEQLDDLEKLIDADDGLLHGWITGKSAAPGELQGELLEKLKRVKFSTASYS